jgi:hypothetical protein
MPTNVISPTEVVSYSTPRPNALRSTEKTRRRHRSNSINNDRNNDSPRRKGLHIVDSTTAADFDKYYGVHQTGKGLTTERLQRYLKENENLIGNISSMSEWIDPKNGNINVSCIRQDENCISHVRQNKESYNVHHPETLASTENKFDPSQSTPLQPLLPQIEKKDKKTRKSRTTLPPHEGKSSKNVKPKSVERKNDKAKPSRSNDVRNNGVNKSKANCQSPLIQGRMLSCVRGGKVVGARVAECIFVTAEAYEQEFGGKHRQNPHKDSMYFDEQSTMSTTGSSNIFATSNTKEKNLQDSGSKDYHKNRLLSHCVVPDSSLSGSSSSEGTNFGNKSKRLQSRFDSSSISKEQSIRRKESSTYLKTAERPPRILNISKLEKTEQDNFPLNLGNAIDPRHGPENDACGRAPLSLHADILPEILPKEVYSHRRPRGYYSNISGEAVPYDELSGQIEETLLHNAESDFQNLRSLRLEMFLRSAPENQNNPAQPTDSCYQSGDPIPSDGSLGTTQEACTSTEDMVDKNQTDNVDQLYKSALRDLEAQDKIIQTLLKEYDNTKRTLSHTQKELEVTKSIVPKQVPKINSLESNSKVSHWRDAEDKLISEIHENRNLLKKFIDLKEQTKSIKQWLSQPKTTEMGVPKTVIHSTTLGDGIALNDVVVNEVVDSDTASGGNIEMQHSLILSLRAQLLEAQSSRLVTVERLVKLNQDNYESNIDANFFQSKLEKLKKEREDSNTNKATATSEEKEVYRLREEVSKLTTNLRISNGLCTDHRRKVSNLERELVTINDEARTLRVQVDNLLHELHSTKRDYDGKNQSNITEARLFQDEIRKMKQILNPNP